jgi:FkbM family methyltransferase
MSSAVFRNPLKLSQRCLQSVLMRVRPAPLAVMLKKILGVGRMVIDTPHGKFWIDPITILGLDLSTRGVYETEMVKTLQKFLPAAGTFVDAGANEGYFTVLGAKLCGASGRVIAIEPQERLLPVIAENLRLNGLEFVRVLNIAVADQRGVAMLHLASDTNSGTTGLHREFKYYLPTQQVETQTLAQILDSESLGRVDVMKMDIEGFEYEAVLGSSEVFREHRVRVLALDLHPTILANRGKDISDISKMLAECGYSMSQEYGNTVWQAPSGAL